MLRRMFFTVLAALFLAGSLVGATVSVANAGSNFTIDVKSGCGSWNNWCKPIVRFVARGTTGAKNPKCGN